MTPESRGLICYLAYGLRQNFRTPDGQSMPTWDDLDERTRAAWILAAGAIWDLATTGQATFENSPTPAGD